MKFEYIIALILHYFFEHGKSEINTIKYLGLAGLMKFDYLFKKKTNNKQLQNQLNNNKTLHTSLQHVLLVDVLSVSFHNIGLQVV